MVLDNAKDLGVCKRFIHKRSPLRSADGIAPDSERRERYTDRTVPSVKGFYSVFGDRRIGSLSSYFGYQRGDGFVQFLIRVARVEIGEEMPLFHVFRALSGFQCHHGCERLNLHEASHGEGFVIAPVIRVFGAVHIGKLFDE